MRLESPKKIDLTVSSINQVRYDAVGKPKPCPSQVAHPTNSDDRKALRSVQGLALLRIVIIQVLAIASLLKTVLWKGESSRIVGQRSVRGLPSSIYNIKLFIILLVSS
jgi:hypothetical protein